MPRLNTNTDKAISSHLLILGDCPVVHQSVVVEEEPAGDVEGNKHINTKEVTQ